MKTHHSSLITHNPLQKGQVVIILLLVMLVALSVGLAITQRSITNVTTSTQNEQSTKAFSAAEAGIETAFQGCNPGQYDCMPIQPITLNNQSSANVLISPPLPNPKLWPTYGDALEWPAISKEEVAQIWLSNPKNPTYGVYTAPSFKVYFGNENSTTDKPAIEVNVITYNSTSTTYSSNRYFYDSDSTRATNQNNFKSASCSPPPAPIPTINIRNSPQSQFYCVATVPPQSGCSLPGCNPDYLSAGIPVMARIRVLYSGIKQKLAIQPYVPTSPSSCPSGKNCNLPPQATIYTSTGEFGLSKKTISVFKAIAVPPFFDFAIFSAGDIAK